MLEGTETHYLRKTRRVKRIFFRAIPVILSISVALATAYALIVPGLTMNKDTTIAVETSNTEETLFTEQVTQVSSPEGVEPENSTADTTVLETTADETSATVETTDISTGTEPVETTVTTPAPTSTLPDDVPAESAVPSASSADATVPQETVAEPSEYFYENESIYATATLDPQVILPEGAAFRITEISQETDPERYADFVKLLSDNSEQVAQSVPAGKGILAYDIGFFVGEDEVEPEGGSVSVTIVYKDAAIEVENPEDVSIFHVEESGTEMALEPVVTEEPIVSEDGVVEEVSFEAQSFSPFLITGTYTMSSSLHYELIDQQSELFTNTSYYNQASALNLVGSFHIVAFDTLRLDAHTNGNFCAKDLYAGTNFGTNNYGAELSYVQNYLQVTSTDAADYLDILVVGSSNAVSLVDNGNAFAVNGTKIDKPYTIWQDNDTGSMPFLDLSVAEAGIKSVAAGLAMQPNMNLENYLATYGDPYQSYLKITNVNEPAVFNMTSSQLESYANGFSIRGFTQDAVGSVILNIDCAGDANVTVPKILMQVGSEMLNFKELTSFSSGKIILNFVNSANANIALNLTYASIIAPDANIIAYQNVNGAIIGNNVTIKAESHRTDFTGVLPAPITGSASVTKSWKAFDGTALTGAAIADMSVQAQLYCNGTALADAKYLVTLNSANSWTYKWQELPIVDGQVYTIKESSISKNGVVVQTGDAAQSYEVTYASSGTSRDVVIAISNRVITGNVSVNKQWLALDGITSLTAEEVQNLSVLVQLNQNGTPMPGPEYQVTLSLLNNWTHEWTSLPIGSNQTYSVEEKSISRTTQGVTEVIQSGGLHTLYDVTYYNNAGITNGSIDVINKVKTGTITVEKTWYDKDGYPMFGDQISGFSVTIQLYCNGAAMTDPEYTIELSTANNWTYSWTELPIDSGQIYTVVESDYGGYSVMYENNNGINNGTILVKNSRGHADVLPSTGSIGTTGYYLTGAIFTLISLLLLIIQKRRHRKRRGELSG